MTISLQESEHLDSLGSADCIVYDPAAESITVTFDETRDSATITVVSVVAAVLGKDPMELPPLYSVVGSNRVREIERKSTTDQDAPTSTSIEYLEFDVTVSSDGTIEAVPSEHGGEDGPRD